MRDVRAWRVAENERTERKLAEWCERYGGDRELDADEEIEAERALTRACAAVDYTRDNNSLRSCRRRTYSTATGRAVVRGSATEALTIAAAATGRAVVRGSATEALTVSATATGRAVVRGSATEALMVNATATGRAIVRGSGAAVVMITGSASGGANTQGSAAATLTVSASAVGRAVVVGAGTAAVGVVATAAAPVITNSAPNIIVRRMLTSTQAGTITISQETHVTTVVRQTVDLDVQIHRSDETVVIV